VGIDERKTAIISAVIAVSHEVGSPSSPGIETEERSAGLELGCDRGRDLRPAHTHRGSVDFGDAPIAVIRPRMDRAEAGRSCAA
jgi:hypothetical protein